tara:strand:+ start:837 stop:1454 length:618 start_codon:yes stop_codon:yes gene_type:complete
MKNIIILTSLLFLSYTNLFSQNYPILEIGERFPTSVIDYEMKSIYGQDQRVSQHLEKKGLIIIFTSNNCPFVDAWEDRYKMIEEMCRRYDFDMLYINSNHNKRDREDSFQSMQVHAKKMGYSYHYLLDEKSQLANALGAKTTPHVFLFDSQSKLVYRGAIDDNYESSADVKEFYLKDAIKYMSADKEVKVAKTKAVGCSIKRYNP